MTSINNIQSSGIDTGDSTMTPESEKKGSTLTSSSVRKPRVALITNIYRPGAHADKIGTKFFLGIPTDEGLISPDVEIVSIWIDQIGSNDIGNRMAEMNNAKVYPTIAEALTLGSNKLAVDAVIYIGEHGTYPQSRLGVTMYPRLNHLEQIFRVFDFSNEYVPVFSDKYLAYSWLDSKWIYDRAKELNVPMMAGSSLPYCRRDPVLEHPIGTEITEAVAIGGGELDSYGIHTLEMLQCMIERRAGGETGVETVQGLKGDAVWRAIDTGEISLELVESACNKIKGKTAGSMRELVIEPSAILIQYNDGLKAVMLTLDGYVNSSWGYSARADGETVATEFILSPGPIFAHFSYQALNIQRFIKTGGKPPVPIERNLLTNGILDMGIRSIMLKAGKVIKTPFLDMHYTAEDGYAIWPKNSVPTGNSIGPWPPKGYEFIMDE